jgi:phospholipase C
VERSPRFDPDKPALNPSCEFQIVNRDNRHSRSFEIRDNAYHSGNRKTSIEPGANASVVIDTQKSFGWYDMSVRVQDLDGFAKRYAGRAEAGKWSYSDPALGRSGSVTNTPKPRNAGRSTDA